MRSARSLTIVGEGGTYPGGVPAHGGTCRGGVPAGCACLPREYLLLNIGYVSNETKADVHMYIEEFILVEIWIHCCTNWKWFTLENTLAFIYTQQ